MDLWKLTMISHFTLWKLGYDYRSQKNLLILNWYWICIQLSHVVLVAFLFLHDEKYFVCTDIVYIYIYIYHISSYVFYSFLIFLLKHVYNICMYGLHTCTFILVFNINIYLYTVYSYLINRHRHDFKTQWMKFYQIWWMSCLVCLWSFRKYGQESRALAQVFARQTLGCGWSGLWKPRIPADSVLQMINGFDAWPPFNQIKIRFNKYSLLNTGHEHHQHDSGYSFAFWYSKLGTWRRLCIWLNPVESIALGDFIVKVLSTIVLP